MANTRYYGTITATAPATTAGGTAYVRETIKFGGDGAVAYVPTKVKDGTPVTVVFASHGYTENETFMDPAIWATGRDMLLGHGWVVVSTNNQGFQWGSQKAMDMIYSAHAWASDRWTVAYPMLAGGSMGGLTVLNALGRDVIPGVVATVAMVSVVDTQAMGAGYHGSIKAAYGVTDMAQLTTAQAGYDPLRDDPQKWAGKDLYLNQGASDTIVVPALHGDKFMARAATPERIKYVIGNHGHSKTLDADMVAWMAQRAPDYTPPSTDPDPPPPGGEGGPTVPAAPSGSGVYWPDGREASLYRADGTLVRLNRP